jgi:HEAT repeat protein
MQPSELENLEYYEFHYLVKDLVDYLKEENKQNQGQNDASSGMMNNMKVPNMKVPNMKMPKM